MATAELIFQITPRGGADFKSTMAQVRSELTQSGQTQTTVAKGELSTRQQLAAASSLQRQRSAALIGEWKRTETAASNLARGVQPVATNLQRVTDIMQTLGASSATLTGPLGGVAGRLRSIGTLATEAGGGIGIAGAAIGALIVAAVGASVAIYKLTVQTAEFQGKMFDLSQQTGVAVETLSALEIGAATTGGSIDTISQSLFQFQRNLEDAHDPTSKEAKLLKDLGVETSNTEVALRQAFTALFRMTDTIKQTDAAATLFGARGGKQVLAILKEWNGDLDGAITQFRKLGILIDTDTAKAADKFNDQLTMLQFQLRAVVALVGREAMPAILRAVESVSKAFVDNQGVISAWAREIGDAGRGALILGNLLLKLGGIITGLGNIPIPVIFSILKGGTWLGNLLTLLQGVNKLLGANPLLNMGVATGAVSAVGDLLGPKAKGGGAGKGGKGSKTPRDTSLEDATKDAELTEREILQRLATETRLNKNELDNQIVDIETFTRDAIELAEQRHDATIVRINAEIAALDEAFAKKLIKQKEYDRKSREIDIDNAEAIEKKNAEIAELEDARDKKVTAADLAAHERSARLADEASERLITNIQDRVDRQILSEAEGERQIAALLAQGYERRKKLLEDELDNYGVTLERREAITDELIRLDGERAQAAVDASQRIIDALKKEREEFEKRNREAFGVERPRRVGDATRPRQVEPQDRSAIDQLEEHFEDLRAVNPDDAGLIAMQAGVTALTDAFQGLGQAIGTVVEAWVLYGSAGTSVRKVTAQILAGVAAQAAVKAVFELAEGFAALALAFFGLPNAGPSAAAHFTAAAIYGTIAGVAAIAGRAVAGDAFTKQAGGSTGTSSRESTAPERRGQPTTIDVNRKMGAQSSAQSYAHEIVFKVKGDAVIDEFVRDYDLNGRTRIKIQTDGQG